MLIQLREPVGVIDVPARRSRALLRAVTDLCAELELDEIAEGVQDATSRDVLMEVGCRYGQGFLYAHAMPIDEAIAWDQATTATT